MSRHIPRYNWPYKRRFETAQKNHQQKEKKAKEKNQNTNPRRLNRDINKS